MKMDINKMIGMVVGVMVGVLILSAALFPVIDSATTTERTFTNEGYFFMEKIDEGTPMTVVWDYTKPTTLTVNGDDVPLPDKEHMSTIPFTIFCSETWLLRYAYNSTDGYYVGAYQNASSTAYTGTVTDSRSLTISVTDAGVTTVDNGTAHTWSNASGDFYVISETGDYIMKKMDKDAYVLGDSPIFGYGRTYARNYNYLSELTGNVDDGITGGYYPENTITTAGWTISDVTLNSTAQTAYKDLYKVSSMTYEITGEGIIPYTATFSQYIVPASVTAELAVHASQDEIELLETIPILITVGLIMGIVGVVAARRFE